MGESLPNHQEDHIAGKGDNSLQHYNLVHKFILMVQAMKIPAAKGSSGQGMWKIGENFGVEVRSKKEVIDKARTKGIKVHFDLLQNLNLEIALIDNAEPHYPHDNFGGNHLCDGCRKLIVPNVCHRLVSILWQIMPIYLMTTECQVGKFVPSTSILIQYKSKLLTIHYCSPILPF